jgi:hypothetical protein
MTDDLERQVIQLVATDRLYIPSSSFDGKLERSRPKLAKALDFSDGDFQGERAYARVVDSNKHVSKDMRAGIAKFEAEHPQYGKILNGYIEEARVKKEQHVYFGMNDGKRVTREDYLGVIEGMGLGPAISERYLDAAMDISRTMQAKREKSGKPEAERRVLIG